MTQISSARSTHNVSGTALPPSSAPLYPTLENSDLSATPSEPPTEGNSDAEASALWLKQEGRKRRYLLMTILGAMCNTSLSILDGRFAEYFVFNAALFMYVFGTKTFTSPGHMLTVKRAAGEFLHGTGKCIMMCFGLWVCMFFEADRFGLAMSSEEQKDAGRELMRKMCTYLVLFFGMRVSSFFTSVYRECQDGLQGIFPKPTSRTRKQNDKNDKVILLTVAWFIICHVVFIICLIVEAKSGLAEHFLSLLVTVALGYIAYCLTNKEEAIVNNQMKWFQAACAQQNYIKEQIRLRLRQMMEEIQEPAIV